jgi:hypothetical protein
MLLQRVLKGLYPFSLLSEEFRRDSAVDEVAEMAVFVVRERHSTHRTAEGLGRGLLPRLHTALTESMSVGAYNRKAVKSSYAHRALVGLGYITKRRFVYLTKHILIIREGRDVCALSRAGF